MSTTINRDSLKVGSTPTIVDPWALSVSNSTVITGWSQPCNTSTAIDSGWGCSPLSEYVIKHLQDEYEKYEKREKKKEVKKMEFASIKINWPDVKKIEVLKPGKVVRVTVVDNVDPCRGKSEPRTFKMICKEGDTFDLRMAVAIALIKAKGLNLTPEGNEAYARHFLMYYKDFAKIVDKGVKQYEKELKEKEKRKAKEAEIKAIKERRRKKAAEKRKKKQEAKKCPVM